MRRFVTLAGSLLALLAFAGCASRIALSSDERSSVERALKQQPDRFLRVSFYVTPFFGDPNKKLLTAVPPELVRLVENPDHTPVNPGPIEKILPVGTRAKIEQVQFPTPFVMAGRVLYSPRYDTWVLVRVEGEPQPLVVVLPAQLKSEGDFLAELERYLSLHDPAPRMEGWGEKVREAVRAKRTEFEMPAEALEMAWGYPEQKRISYAGSTREEEWSWADGKRKAFLSNGRLTRTE